MGNDVSMYNDETPSSAPPPGNSDPTSSTSSTAGISTSSTAGISEKWYSPFPNVPGYQVPVTCPKRSDGTVIFAGRIVTERMAQLQQETGSLWGSKQGGSSTSSRAARTRLVVTTVDSSSDEDVAPRTLDPGNSGLAYGRLNTQNSHHDVGKAATRGNLSIDTSSSDDEEEARPCKRTRTPSPTKKDKLRECYDILDENKDIIHKACMELLMSDRHGKPRCNLEDASDVELPTMEDMSNYVLTVFKDTPKIAEAIIYYWMNAGPVNGSTGIVFADAMPNLFKAVYENLYMTRPDVVFSMPEVTCKGSSNPDHHFEKRKTSMLAVQLHASFIDPNIRPTNLDKLRDLSNGGDHNEIEHPQWKVRAYVCVVLPCLAFVREHLNPTNSITVGRAGEDPLSKQVGPALRRLRDLAAKQGIWSEKKLVLLKGRKILESRHAAGLYFNQFMLMYPLFPKTTFANNVFLVDDEDITLSKKRAHFALVNEKELIGEPYHGIKYNIDHKTYGLVGQDSVKGVAIGRGF